MIKQRVEEELTKWANVITILEAHVKSINKALEESDNATDTTELTNRLQQADASMFEAKIAVRTLTWVLEESNKEISECKSEIEEDE